MGQYALQPIIVAHFHVNIVFVHIVAAAKFEGVQHVHSYPRLRLTPMGRAKHVQHGDVVGGNFRIDSQIQALISSAVPLFGPPQEIPHSLREEEI